MMSMQDVPEQVPNGFTEGLRSPQPPQCSPLIQGSTATNQTYQPFALNRNIAARPAPKRTHQTQPSASCTLCRLRKVKCDRGTPCSSCVRTGAECIPSVPSQGPRGRKGGRKRRIDGELLERIAKLEGLLKNGGDGGDRLGVAPYHQNSAPTVVETDQPSQPTISYHFHKRPEESRDEAAIHRGHNPGEGLNRYLGSSLWMTLSEEISGLRDVLNGSSDEEDEGTGGQTPISSLNSGRQQSQQANDSGFIFSSLHEIESSVNPTSHQLFTFCEIYLANVDPVMKILHAPSLRKYMQEGAATLDCSPGPKGIEALKFAVCFAAVVSMTDEECRHRIGEEKMVMIAKYRARTEQALSKADFVNTIEMSTLQALTLYLVIFSLSLILCILSSGKC